jgi:hypothetical protein
MQMIKKTNTRFGGGNQTSGNRRSLSLSLYFVCMQSFVVVVVVSRQKVFSFYTVLSYVVSSFITS